MRRTNTCNDLRKKNVGKKVVLCGWVQNRRDHGGVIFIDLRDRYGLTQVVFDPSHNNNVHKSAEAIRREYVLEVEGIVRDRKEGMINPKMDTGEVEVIVDKLDILNESETPPIEIDDRKVAGEDMRLKYRYLDLRRPQMQNNLLLRHNAMQAARKCMSDDGFLEIETPMLVRSTPEGARDFIVPSRVHPGTVYSLPQSPQLYKQLLMVSGFDRYFQITRCFRDEDGRTDRQTDFTQIDVEMSFPEQEDVLQAIEKVVASIFSATIGLKIKTPFMRITYAEAMKRFGSDKPDMRFGLELKDISVAAEKSDFGVFKSALDKGGQVKCISVPGGAEFSRKKVEDYTEFVKIYKAKGLAWAKVVAGGLESSIAKFFSAEVQKEIIKSTGSKDGDLLLFVADKPKVVAAALGNLRNKIAAEMNLYNPKEFNLLWVIDFPLFEWDEDIEGWAPAHHMFTMPKEDCLKFLESEPEKVIADCYDLVLNGSELGSGSIRVNRPDIQKRIMKAMNISDEEAEAKFGFLLEAFRYGAPPHGGFAIGFDRLISLIVGTSDIKEVLAFPKNRHLECPMDGCPSPIGNEDLKEVHLKWNMVKKK